MNRFVRAFQEWDDASIAPRQRLPTALQFPINDICNSHCQMCHIWKQKRDYEISVAEIRRVLSDPLYRKVESVGINGGEPTLRTDLESLVATVVETLPALKGVALITNAIKASRVIAVIDGIGRICSNAGKQLDVMVSIDGVGAVHDRVRGVPGNFRNAELVIEHLLSTPWVSSRRIGCTIIAENAFHVQDVLEFAKQKNIYARFRLGVPHPRLYTNTLKTPFALGTEELFHVAAFLDTLIHDYERDSLRRAFYQSLRNQLVYGRPRAAGCVWRNHGVTLGPRGELAFCAVASPQLGNAREQSSEKVYWGNSKTLRAIQTTKCADCRHDYDGAGNRRLVLRRWLGRVSRRLPRVSRIVWTGLGRWENAREWAAILSWPNRARYSESKKRPASVLLCGWYGTETLGDRAILAGLCRLIAEELPGAAVDVASLEPYVTNETCRVMPELNVRRVLGLPEAMTDARRGNYGVVAVAGGPMMTAVREVIDLAKLLEIARNAGASTALLGCGLGPMGAGGPRRFAIEKLVREARYCIFRDHSSAALARTFGRVARNVASLDPAFFWTALQSETKRVFAGRPVVAIAWRDWPLEAYAANLPPLIAEGLKAKFEAELIVLVETLHASGCEIVPVCMHTLTVGGDDRAFYRKLFGRRPDLGVSVPWRRRDPRDELAQMQRADGVVAMRFHSCVFALALGKPFLALDYTRGGKIAGLLSDSGNFDRLVDLEHFDGRENARRILADVAVDAMPNPPAIAAGEQVYRAVLQELAQGMQVAPDAATAKLRT